MAKYADLWNAGGLGIDALTRKIGILEEHCGRIGRDGSDIEKTFLAPLYWRSNAAEAEQLLTQIPQVQMLISEHMRSIILARDVAAVQRQVQAYTDVGITHIIIALRRLVFYDREGLRLFAKEVKPAFR